MPISSGASGRSASRALRMMRSMGGSPELHGDAIVIQQRMNPGQNYKRDIRLATRHAL
jgi:hypothetical protein